MVEALQDPRNATGCRHFDCFGIAYNQNMQKREKKVTESNYFIELLQKGINFKEKTQNIAII